MKYLISKTGLLSVLVVACVCGCVAALLSANLEVAADTINFFYEKIGNEYKLRVKPDPDADPDADPEASEIDLGISTFSGNIGDYVEEKTTLIEWDRYEYSAVYFDAGRIADFVVEMCEETSNRVGCQIETIFDFSNPPEDSSMNNLASVSIGDFSPADGVDVYFSNVADPNLVGFASIMQCRYLIKLETSKYLSLSLTNAYGNVAIDASGDDMPDAGARSTSIIEVNLHNFRGNFIELNSHKRATTVRFTKNPSGAENIDNSTDLRLIGGSELNIHLPHGFYWGGDLRNTSSTTPVNFIIEPPVSTILRTSWSFEDEMAVIFPLTFRWNGRTSRSEARRYKFWVVPSTTLPKLRGVDLNNSLTIGASIDLVTNFIFNLGSDGKLIFEFDGKLNHGKLKVQGNKNFLIPSLSEHLDIVLAPDHSDKVNLEQLDNELVLIEIENINALDKSPDPKICVGSCELTVSQQPVPLSNPLWQKWELLLSPGGDQVLLRRNKEELFRWFRAQLPTDEAVFLSEFVLLDNALQSFSFSRAATTTGFSIGSDFHFYTESSLEGYLMNFVLETDYMFQQSRVSLLAGYTRGTFSRGITHLATSLIRFAYHPQPELDWISYLGAGVTSSDLGRKRAIFLGTSLSYDKEFSHLTEVTNLTVILKPEVGVDFAFASGLRDLKDTSRQATMEIGLQVKLKIYGDVDFSAIVLNLGVPVLGRVTLVRQEWEKRESILQEVVATTKSYTEHDLEKIDLLARQRKVSMTIFSLKTGLLLSLEHLDQLSLELGYIFEISNKYHRHALHLGFNFYF